MLLQPGDRILSLDLAAGGHLSRGAGANLSGRWFDSHRYGVDRASGLIDYDEVEARAREVRPALLIAAGSAYPRTIDFERMAGFAEAVEARLLVGMARIAGLVAAHASPLPHADIVTCTTTKTLRGSRGGLILARSEAFARGLQSPRCFPGYRGAFTPTFSPPRRCAGAKPFGSALPGRAGGDDGGAPYIRRGTLPISTR